VITNYTVPGPNGQLIEPWDIALGPDGNLWFTELGQDKIGRITPSGTIKAFKTINGGAPMQIAAGPDGYLWYTEEGVGNHIFKISTDGATQVDYLVSVGAGLADINPGPDGNMWFTDQGLTQVGWVNTSGSSSVEWPVSAGANPTGISAGPDGNLWFTEPGIDNIGQITPSGSAYNEAPIPTPGAGTFFGITPGADGNMWFSESDGNNIGVTQPQNVTRSTIEWCCNRVFIPNETHVPDRGDTVTWMTLSPQIHGVVDGTGMRLYGYGPTGGPLVVPIGQSLSFQFRWSGVYSYADPFHGSSRGKVKVPIGVQPLVGAPGAKVIWASGDAPGGDVFDVQVRQPGSSSFLDWRSGVTSLNGAFGSSDPLWAGPGKYSFRARLRQPSSGAASGYSAAGSIRLS
jgi:streptogramin lyase